MENLDILGPGKDQNVRILLQSGIGFGSFDQMNMDDSGLILEIS